MVWLYFMIFGGLSWKVQSLRAGITWGLSHSWWFMLAVGWRPQFLSTWPSPCSLSPGPVWVSSQHGVWVPRRSIPRQTGRSCTFSWPGLRSHIAWLSSSSIGWNSHKPPGFKGWGNRLYLWTRSWKSIWDQKWCKGHFCKIQPATTRKVLEQWQKV